MPSKTTISYTGNYCIRTYEIDSRKIATVPALLKLMHEAAMQNVIKLKLSVWDMEPIQISWVLMRQHLKINRLPVLGEKVKVLTTPAGFEKVFTYRDYKVFDEKGEILAYSSSTWLLMNTMERRITRIPDFILEYQKAMPSPSDCLPRPTNKLPKFEIAHSSKSFRVDWHDLDFNQHMSNVFYIQWMLEALDDQMIVKGKLKVLDILYKMEGRWHDDLVSEVQKLDGHTFLHRLLRNQDGKELALAQSKWELPENS